VVAFDRVRLELEMALSDGRTPAFTVSAGVVDTGESLGFDELIALADTLLLRAKRSGRNQVLSVGRVDNVTSLADVSSSSVA
jgi:PleD family two-component response regulator